MLITMPAKMITYRFFFEGLITEFGNNYRTGFFPWGLFFEFGNNYRPVFPQGSHFRVRLKMPETGFIPWRAVFESGKKYRKLVAQSLLSINAHFLNFLL